MFLESDKLKLEHFKGGDRMLKKLPKIATKGFLDDSQKKIPVDSQGQPLQIGQLVKAEVFVEPKKVKINGKEFFLGSSGVLKIYGKIIFVGQERCLISEESKKTWEVKNEKITVIV